MECPQPPQINSLTRKAMHFLTALCGGFSGGFITGGALLDGHWVSGGTTVGLSATGGLALAILTWWGYRKIPEDGVQDFPLIIGIGETWTLEYVARTVAGSQQAAIDFGKLTPKERGALVIQQQLGAKSWEALLETLRSVTRDTTVRPYSVKKVGSTFHFEVK